MGLSFLSYSQSGPDLNHRGLSNPTFLHWSNLKGALAFVPFTWCPAGICDLALRNKFLHQER